MFQEQNPWKQGIMQNPLQKDVSSNLQKTLHTLPETNIAPENRPSQKESSIPTIHF